MAPTSSVTPAGACLMSHLTCLRFCGFCRLAPHSHAFLYRAHFFYCLYALFAQIVYAIQESIYAYQAKADMEKLSRVMFLCLTHWTSIGKQIVFFKDYHRIDAVIADLDDPLLNQASALSGLKSTAQSAFRLHFAYSSTAVITCILWVTISVIEFVRGQPQEFAFWLPASTPVDHPFVFSVILLVYSVYMTTWDAIANTTMDSFIGTVLFQCTTQFKVLRNNLETLPERAREVSTLTSRTFESVRLELFYECLLHYDKIIKITSDLQDIFGTAIFILFTISGWMLCMAVYKVVSVSILSMEFASMNLFVICILTELFVFCFYGNELAYESNQLLDALYACGWEGSEGRGRHYLQVRDRRRFERALLLAGERARRPLIATAGRLLPLSLGTFIKIIKSSYTFFAVLRVRQ